MECRQEKTKSDQDVAPNKIEELQEAWSVSAAAATTVSGKALLGMGWSEAHELKAILVAPEDAEVCCGSDTNQEGDMYEVHSEEP